MGRPIVNSHYEIQVFAAGRLSVHITGEMCPFFQPNDKRGGSGTA